MNNLNLTLANYTEILKDFSIDVKDEVRSAILDGVDLSPYIKKYSNDPFRLQQIRLSLKEFPDISPDFFVLDGGNLLKVRGYLRENKLSGQCKELLRKDVDQEGFSVMLDLDSKGFDLSRYDFSKIPNSLLKEFSWGIRLGVDISHLANGVKYPKSFIIACIRLESYGVSTERFVKEGWCTGTVIKLSKYAGHYLFNKLYEYLGPESISEYVECFMELLCSGVEDPIVFSKDENGYEVFMPSQLHFIAETAAEGFSVTDMINPELSLEEMYLIKSFEREKTGRKLKLRGVLGK